MGNDDVINVADQLLKLVVFITPRVIEESVLTEAEAEFLEATETPSPQLPVTRIDSTTGKIK